MVEVENMDEAAIAAELDRAFGENPAAFNGEKRVARLDDEDILDKGAPDHEELRMYYFGSLTITISKIKKWRRRVTSWRTRLVHPGTKPCRSQTMTRPWCMKISL
jgi:hypothetical protein